MMEETKPIMMTAPVELEFDEKVQESAKLIERQIQKQKWAIIKQKLKEISKLNLIKDLELQRFKNLMIEVEPDREVVYYRDGSLKGKRLVTFVSHNEASVEGSEFKTKLLYF